MQPNDENSTEQTNNTLPTNDSAAENSPTTAPPVAPETNTSTPSEPVVIEPETSTVSEAEPVAASSPDPSTTPATAITDSPVQNVTSAEPTNTPENVTTAGDSPVAAPAAGAGVIAGAALSNAGSSDGSKKSKKKLLVVGGIIAVVLLLLAGSAAAYFGVYLPRQPQKIAGEALANTVNSEKFKSTKFEGEVAISGGEVSKAISSITFEGALSAESQAVDLKVSAHTAVTKVNLDIRSTDGKSAYIRLSGLDGLDKLLAAAGGSSPEAAAVSQFAPFLAQLNNQWFTVDQSLFSQMSGSDVVSGNDKISDEDAQRIGEIYKKHQFLSVDKRLADEDIHGVSSYHIQATIKKAELKAFMTEVKSANIKGLKIEQKDIDELDKIDFSKYPFEMWVSKKDRFITQLAASFEDKGTTYKTRVALKDINQPVTVEKPADARSILELLSSLYQQPSAQSTGTNPFLSL